MARVGLASKYERNRNLALAALVASTLASCLSSAALAQGASCSAALSSAWRQSAISTLPQQSAPQQTSSAQWGVNDVPALITPEQAAADQQKADQQATDMVQSALAAAAPTLVMPQAGGQSFGTAGSNAGNLSGLGPTGGGANGTPTFSDNFSNGIDLAKWGYNYPWSDGCNGSGNADATQDAAYMNPSCGSQAGANVFATGANGLDIAIKPTPGGVDASGKPYVTGQLYSKTPQLYGYFEMTAKLPATTGVGGAFWLMPADGSWPPELDVMENLGQDPNTVYSTIHGVGTPQLQTTGTVAGGVQNAFHTYGVDWEADKTTFFVDGKATGSFTTPDGMKKPMYMILSMNSSPPGHSNWGNSVDGSTQLPADYQVQSVRAFAANPYTGN